MYNIRYRASDSISLNTIDGCGNAINTNMKEIF